MATPRSLRILASALPEVEREQARFVSRNLDTLDEMAAQLQYATQLFEFGANSTAPLDQRRIHRNWSMMGAKCGALFIYGFHRTTQALMIALRKSPSLTGLVDRSALKLAWKKFDEYFPNFADIRLNAAHPGELYNSPEKFKEHVSTLAINSSSLTTTESSFLLDGSVVDGAYTCTIEGKLFSYLPNAATAAKLQDVSDAIWQEFVPAANYTSELLLSKQQQESQRQLE